MDGAEEQAGVVLERRLGAIAVVHVEVDHRHPGHAQRLGFARGDGHIGEQAEPHGLVRLRVVARGTHGGEGAISLAARHGPHRLDRRPRRQSPGPHASRRQHRVSVQRYDAGGGRGVQNPLNVGLGVDADQGLNLGLRRLATVQRQARVVHGVQHGRQPGGALGVPLAGVVGEHVVVGDEQGHESQSSEAAGFASRAGKAMPPS